MEISNGKMHLFDTEDRDYTRCGRQSINYPATGVLASVTCGRCLMLVNPAPTRQLSAAELGVVKTTLVRALAPGRDALALHIARHVAYGFAPDQEMLASFRATDVYGPGRGHNPTMNTYTVFFLIHGRIDSIMVRAETHNGAIGYAGERLPLGASITEVRQDDCGAVASPRKYGQTFTDPVCHEAPGHSGTHIGMHRDGTRTGFHA